MKGGNVPSPFETYVQWRSVSPMRGYWLIARKMAGAYLVPIRTSLQRWGVTERVAINLDEVYEWGYSYTHKDDALKMARRIYDQG